jgi:hypothetical protein
MCSGLADVIYDFHAVIGTVPAGRCSGKQPKNNKISSLLISQSRLAEKSLRDFFLFFFRYKNTNNKNCRATTTTAVIKQHDSNEALKLLNFSFLFLIFVRS